jgi:uncharacterized membrane protein (DUF373 family)
MSEVEEKPAEKQAAKPSRFTTTTNKLLERVEHGFYLAMAVLLCVTALLALIGAAIPLFAGMTDLNGTTELVELTDRLLFVLMLVEIMHTVRVSIREGGLSAEPFLIVGLIASIRRMLVITLESSQATTGKDWTDQTEAFFRASMIELGVLGGLIIVLVVSLFLIRRARPHAAT